MMKKTLITGGAALLMLGTANAAVIDTSGTFEDFKASGPGVHGVELRGGDGAGRAQWELGVGTQTSVSGSFAQGQVDWAGGDGASGRIAEDFLLSFDGAGNAVMTLSRGGSQVASVSYTGLSLGNALRIQAVRLAEVAITSIDGQAVSFDLGDYATAAFDELVLFDQSFTDGFTIGGTLDINPLRPDGRNSNSFSRISFATGDVDAIPVPAAAFLFAPFAAAPVLRRLKKRG